MKRHAPAAAGLALTTAVVLALGGCTAADGAADAEEPTPAVTAPVAETPAPEPTDEPTDEATDDPAEEVAAPDDTGEPAVEEPPADFTVLPAGSPELAMLDNEGGDNVVTGLNGETHGTEGFDRIVIEMDGQALPGWFARFTDEALSPGDGATVPVRGDFVLQVVVRGTAMPDDRDFAVGGGTLTVDGPAVTEVVAHGWHAGERTFFVGIDGDTQPEVTITRSTEGHPRVVIDVAHP